MVRQARHNHLESELNALNIKKTTTCEVRNPVPGLGQVLKCGGVKLINGILCSIRHFEVLKMYVDINVVSIQ
jgi:hypothetical protein